MNEEITTAIIVEERTPKSDGTYPIKIRVTYRRTQRYYKTGFSLTKEDFFKAFKGNPKGDLKTIKIKLDAKESKALDIIDTLHPFNFDEFKEFFFDTKKLTGRDAFKYLDNRIAQLISEDRIKSSGCCTAAKASLLKFNSNKPVLLFEKITPDFLLKYEQWMISQSKSSATIGIYLRELRAVLNRAIADGNLEQRDYPFGNYKYQIPTAKNIKKGLSTEKLIKVFTYKPKSIGEEKALAFWQFAFLCNGLNFKDIVLLKNEKIHGDMIHFIREKTKRNTKSTPKVITAHYTPEMKKIVKKWGAKGKNPEDYLFPVLNNKMEAMEIEDALYQFIKTTNKNLKRIGNNIGTPMKFTTGVARHAYATKLKRDGVPTPYIADSMGHTTVLTTENYLDGFEDDDVRKYSTGLTDFIPKSITKKSQKR